MDQRFFDQLDRLQRDAREVQPRQAMQYGNSASRSQYEDYNQHYPEDNDLLDDGNQYTFAQPSLDFWPENMPSHTPNMSLQPNTLQPRRTATSQTQEIVGRSFDLSQFAFDGRAGQGSSSSSPFNQPLPSSPAFSASQRRPAPQPAAAPPSFARPQAAYQRDASANVPPVVQGITLVSGNELPDSFRSIFPFPLFNAVQSKCFPVIYKTDDNFVLSSPTGSGKTAILELAICRMMSGYTNGSYKIVYQAPTKSLCAERQRDWQAKFGPFDLQVAELTGDTDNAQLRNVQHASIIITTPEKWDSMTRKWKDHQKLMQMVKLFLIDEVHILKESRGATLEAIVSRMKSIGTNIRFIALSATVPNSQDIATWLGKDSMTPHIPAPKERFGEEFRPVRLSKHVCGYNSAGNDFAFEKMLNSKLPEVISKWSQRKPLMVFCFTRNACVETAKLLSNWWATKSAHDRYWEAPGKRLAMEDKDLRETVSSGVAFHHAGLSIQDRNAIEKGYLEGHINVICCTSTLAVGVNLPCHMVVVKNTVTYQGNACKEYSDLEIMQMLGRAGRPQFDSSAVAVIMTRLQRVQSYEKMVTGQDVLESCLHLNLIDHLNAEIGLGTITNAFSAKKWLSGTFLYVRLKDNPEHYRIDGDISGRNLDERLDTICSKAIQMLEDHDLVNSAPKLHCTEFGNAMARYYLQFGTMKVLLALPPKAKTSEILSAVAQAAEFRDIRFRGGEKTTYKTLNKNGSIKFPIPVNLDAAAHKVSLVIQSVLGSVELPTEDYKQRNEYTTARSVIFSSVHRIVRCVVDCQLYLEDSVTARNALALARSVGAQVWDDSPLCMKQLEGLGLVRVGKLVAAGIKSIDDIDNVESSRLERVVSRHPPYGTRLKEQAQDFPKLRVSMEVVGEPTIKRGEHVAVNVRAEIGFLNQKTPDTFKNQRIYVCLLAELSDGHLVHFARTSAKKLDKGQDVFFGAKLTNSTQTIRAYVMCDALAGTMRRASIKPEIPSSSFPPPKTASEMNSQRAIASHATNTAKRRAEAAPLRYLPEGSVDEFGDPNIDDSDLMHAGNGDFASIDDFEESVQPAFKRIDKTSKQQKAFTAPTVADWEPRQLENGKWACNHACKDKTACKHLCCREGLDKQPRPPKSKEKAKQTDPEPDPKQSKMTMPIKKQSGLATPATSSTAQLTVAQPARQSESKEMRSLERLHSSVSTNTRNVPLIASKSTGIASKRTLRMPNQSRLTFAQAARRVEHDLALSDCGGSDDLLNPDDLLDKSMSSRMSPPPPQPERETFYEDSDEMLDAALVEFDQVQDHQQANSGFGHNDGDSFPFDDQQDLIDELDLRAAGLDKASGASRAPQAFKRPFLEATRDSADNDLEIRPQERKRTTISSPKEPVAKKSRVSALDYFSGQTSFGDDSTPALSRESAAEQMTAQPLKALAAAERVSSPDSIGKWFMEEFGTDDFNYVGRTN